MILNLLYRIRKPAALIGLLLFGISLPGLAQTQAPVLLAPAGSGAAAINAATAVAPAAATSLRTSLELCAVGRLGEHEMAFLTMFILVGCFVFMLQIDHRLIKHGWDIRKALSEPTTLNLVDQNINGPAGSPSRYNSLDSMQRVTVMEASVSRLIAMAGLIMLILFYLGFGIISLYHFGRTCQMPADMGSVTSFLYAGLTFFAPYLITKFSEVFSPFARRLPPSASPLTSSEDDTRLREAIAALRQRDAQTLASLGHPPFQPAQAPVAPPTGPAAAPVLSGSGGQAAVAVAAPVQTAVDVSKPTATPKPAPKPAPAAPPYSAALRLITEFEGFESQAYPDPASGGDPWTIGYGFTRLGNQPVQPGDTISRQEADRLLDQGINSYAAQLADSVPYWETMHPDQRSALISFAWNLGVGFYGSEGFDTISRRLRDKDWPKVPDALCLYCNPGTSVTAGLLRRREAEGSIWSQGVSQLPAPIGYPSATSTATATAPCAPAAQPKPPAAKAHPNPLPVPYFDQMLMSDGEGWRECFSASCGMLAKFWGKCADQNAYNAIRQTYGDTTDAQAQLKALDHLGLDASFRMDGTLAMLKAEIDAGRPVAVGWLHHGASTAPSGGGHWTVVIGYDDTGVIMNDPYGSCDLVSGGYPGGGNPYDQRGRSDHYSYTNWLPRWQPGGSAGWFLTCKP
jgi:GH24 family phage-related lysozyme (muramidase)